jgi:hypothetical protein
MVSGVVYVVLVVDETNRKTGFPGTWASRFFCCPLSYQWYIQNAGMIAKLDLPSII